MPRRDRAGGASGTRSGVRLLACACAVGSALALGCGRVPGSPFEPPTGLLDGRVRLADGMGLPSYAPFDMARTALRPSPSAAAGDACGPALETARTPVQLGQERGLSNIVIAASDFTRLPKHTKTTHRVAVEGCRLDPPVISAMVGDSLWLENRAAAPTALMYGGAPGPIDLASGAHKRIPLVAGVDSLLCTPAAPCGRSDIVVFHHPVHAVSNGHGDFRIARFPAGELVRITAWHPLFEPSETFVWLEPGQRSVVELVLFPKARFLAPAVATP